MQVYRTEHAMKYRSPRILLKTSCTWCALLRMYCRGNYRATHQNPVSGQGKEGSPHQSWTSSCRSPSSHVRT